MAEFNVFEGSETFIAGRVANEFGDIWATPRTLITHGHIWIPNSHVDEAVNLGWEDHGPVCDFYHRLFRRYEDRPC